MIMNREKFEELLLRFAKEMHDVGVTDDMKKIVESKYSRTPNIASAAADEDVRKFCYRHDGYEIEAVQSVKLVVKKCK
tara:strand:+ start:1097 stop:1330 length:234 start_codon:yes stop_codon:yes gene_type:complete